MDYNLLEEEWIPVLYLDGKAKRVGIRKAFEEAGRIRQIATCNPMDRVAILRFLLALMYWYKQHAPDDEMRNGSFRKELIGKLEDDAHCFNLHGDGKRFYQDKSAPSNCRPIGDLLVEFPTETKIAHLRHVRDKEYGLCLACCALGITRFCAWANAYGGGRYSSAINGPTPAYAIPHGDTLFRTLTMNWTPGRSFQREPPWLNDRAPGKASDLDMPAALAWRSRRFWLGDIGNKQEVCAYCGRCSKLIRQMAFTGNWKPPLESRGQQKKFWDKDPHLILVEQRTYEENEENGREAKSGTSPSQAMQRAKRPTVRTTVSFPIPASKVTTHTRFWRRVLLAMIPSKEGAGAPCAKTVMVAGPAANKGLYQDAAALFFDWPSGHAGTPAALDALGKAVESMNNVLRRSTPNPQRQHPNRAAGLNAVSPGLEANLRDAFAPNATPAVSSESISERLAPALEIVVRATTPGSPLRRREAIHRARHSLGQNIERSMQAHSAAPPRSVAANGNPNGEKGVHRE